MVVIAADGGKLVRPNVGIKVGTIVDGPVVDGLAVDGLAVEGLAVEGLAVDGLAVDGAELEGLGVGAIDGSIVGFLVGDIEVGLRLKQWE